MTHSPGDGQPTPLQIDTDSADTPTDNTPTTDTPTADAPTTDAAAAQAPPVAPVALATAPGFFDRVRGLGVVRLDDDRWAAGVASGLARRWGVDPILVRGGFVVVSLMFGIGLALYGLGWLLLPQSNGRIHAQEALAGNITAGAVGGLLATLAGLTSITTGGSSTGANGWGVLIFAGILLWLVSRYGLFSQRTSFPSPSAPTDHTPVMQPYATAVPPLVSGSPEPTFGTPVPPPSPGGPEPVDGSPTWSPITRAPQPTPTSYPGPSARTLTRARTAPSHAWTRIILGLALVAAVIAYAISSSVTTAIAFALAVIGLGLVGAGLRGRRGGGLAAAAVVAVLMAASSVSPSNAVSGASGWTPMSAANAAAGFQAGVAEITIDLTDPAFLTSLSQGGDNVRVPVEMGAGAVTLILPASVPVTVDVQAGAGSIVNEIDSKTTEGMGVRQRITTAAQATGSSASVTVDLRLGAGEIVVKQSAVSLPTPAPST